MASRFRLLTDSTATAAVAAPRLEAPSAPPQQLQQQQQRQEEPRVAAVTAPAAVPLAVATVEESGLSPETQSLRVLRGMLPTMPRAQMAALLAREQATEEPRPAVIKMLEAGLGIVATNA